MAVRSDSTVDHVENFEPVKIGVSDKGLILGRDILPGDTDLLDTFDFTIRAYWRFKNIFLIDMFISLAVGAVGLLASSLTLGTYAGASAGLIALVILAFRLPGRTTRSVVVKRRDEQDLPYLDYQHWWRDEYMKWPDAPQFLYEKHKELWLDDYGSDLQIFNPWAGPNPKTDKTSADVIKQEALNQSGKALAMYRAKTSMMSKYGMQIIVLSVAFLALFMAANRTQELFTDDPTNITASQQATGQGTP